MVVPLIGGVCGAIGMVLSPQLMGFCWVPLIADPGTGFMVVVNLHLLKRFLPVRKAYGAPQASASSDSISDDGRS